MFSSGLRVESGRDLKKREIIFNNKEIIHVGVQDRLRSEKEG